MSDKKEDFWSSFADGFLIVIAFYFFLSVMGLIAGVIDSKEMILNAKACSYQDNYLYYLFPSYRLGCWLGEEKK